MSFLRYLFFVVFLVPLLHLVSCSSDDPDLDTGLESFLLEKDNLEPPPSPYGAKLESQEDFKKMVDGVEINCKRTKYSLCKNYEELITSNPNDQALFPGSIIKGDGLRDGLLTSVSGVERADMKYTIIGDNSLTANPTLSDATQAVNDLVTTSAKEPDAKLVFEMKKVYSSEQALAEIGIDYNLITTQVKSTLGGGLSSTENHVYMHFKQAFYKVAVEYPGQPSSFFGPEVTADDFGAQVSDGSPLCYISTVTYGRSFIAHFSSSSSLTELFSSLETSFATISANTSFETNSTLENAKVDLVVLGGSAEDATAAATIGTPEALYTFMTNGAVPDANTRLTPIGYTVNHISDNSLVKTGNPVEYTVEECDFDNGTQQKVELSNVVIDIVEDCDFWGAGEFYYAFHIVDDSDEQLTDLFENDSTDPIVKRDGESIAVSAANGFFYAPIGTDAFLKIEGVLQQQTSSGSYEKVSDFSGKHYAPYNDLGSFAIELESAADCSAIFNYTLTKVP